MYDTPRKVDSPLTEDENSQGYIIYRRKLPLKIRLQRWFYNFKNKTK